MLKYGQVSVDVYHLPVAALEKKSVRRQLLFPVNDNYFSLSTTITPEAALCAAVVFWF
jgi:hypothetical protein